MCRRPAVARFVPRPTQWVALARRLSDGNTVSPSSIIIAATMFATAPSGSLAQVEIAGVSAPARCASRAASPEHHEVRCELPTSGDRRRHRFIARFSGSHDDTKVSIVPTLNGTPLTCEVGSTTQLMGEDGDVALTCSFSLGETVRPPHVLLVRVKWHHAQYTDFALETE